MGEPIQSFISCHDDTSVDHLTRVSIYKKKKKNRITKRSGRAKVTLKF